MPLVTFDPALQIIALDYAAKTGFAHSCGARAIWLLGSGNERLSRLRDFILDAAKSYGCRKICCEHASFGSHHVHGQALANELLGVVKACAADLRVEIVMYAPTSVKKFLTGHGRAEKHQMLAAARTWFGGEIEDHNVADALALLAMAQQGYVTNTAAKKKPRKPKPLAAGARAPRRKPGYLF